MWRVIRVRYYASTKGTLDLPGGDHPTITTPPGVCDARFCADAMNIPVTITNTGAVGLNNVCWSWQETVTKSV